MLYFPSFSLAVQHYPQALPEDNAAKKEKKLKRYK